MPKSVKNMSDAELDEHIADLAEQKTAIREEQNAAENERQARILLAGLTEPQKRVVALHVGGQMGGTGESKSEKVQ